MSPTAPGELVDEAKFGACTQEDLEAFDEAMAKLRKADGEAAEARAAANELARALLEKGATRRHLARRADVSDQTITHMAYGRK